MRENGSRKISGEFIWAELKLPKLLALCVLLVAIEGLIDWTLGRTLGPEFHTFAIYLAPIVFAAWFGGVFWGIAVAVTSTIVWAIVKELVAQGLYRGAALYWNTGIRLVTFVLVAWLVAEVRKLFFREREAARVDHLTGVANSRAFMESLEMEMQRQHRSGEPLSVVYIDLDDFKSINDTLGHLTGDEVLRKFGEVLRNSVRKLDTVGRLGGDEFAVLMPALGERDARHVVERLAESLRLNFDGSPYRVSFSAGVATFGNGPVDTDSVIRFADDLMFEAKGSGKNAVITKSYGPDDRGDSEESDI